MKRVISIMLFLCMALSTLSALATGFEGEGTETSPYLIESVLDLKALAESVNGGEAYAGKYFKLTQSLDMTGVEWTPIADGYDDAFKGVFDGNHHILSNLTIEDSDRYTGFFGRLDGATIKNLGIENANIVSDYADVAILAGNAKGGAISSCYVTGNIMGAAGVGGILGSTHSSAHETAITNCYARVALSCDGSRYTYDWAGISGWNEATSVRIENCYSACVGEMRPIAGWSDGSAVSNSQFANTYFDKTLSPDFSTEAGRTDLGKTSGELKIQSTFTDWDFENIWAINAGINGGYPYLLGFDGVSLGGAPGAVIITLTDDGENPVTDAEVKINIKDSGEGAITLLHQGGGVYSGYVTTKDETYTVTVNAEVKGDITQSGSAALEKEYVITLSAATSHIHPVCGDDTCEDAQHAVTGEWISVTDEAGLVAMENGKSYYLANDITLENQLEISNEINLCLNGHSIVNDAGDTIYIKDNSIFSVVDCKGNGKIKNTGSGSAIKTNVFGMNMTFNFYSGTIESATGCAYYCGDAGENCVLNQYGGKITSNANQTVVIMDGKGKYNLFGGSVENTKPNYWAVYVAGDETALSISGSVSLNKPIWVNNPIVIAGEIEKPGSAYAIRYTGESGSDVAAVFTSGWNTYMSSADESEYFVAYKDNYTVVKNAEGELELKVGGAAPTPTPSSRPSRKGNGELTGPLLTKKEEVKAPVVTTKTFELTIDKKEALVFGTEKTNDVAPLIKNDRVMLPIRFVAENLGAKVEWNENAFVTITKGDTEIIIYIGKNTAFVDGKEIELDAEAFIENDRTYVPVRFISESLGAKVEWNEKDKKGTITITE